MSLSTPTQSRPDHPQEERPHQRDQFTLTTPRLMLRPPTEADVDQLWPFVTDPRITRFLAWEPHQNQQQTLSMIQSLLAAHQNGRGFHWVICRDNQVIGLISLIVIQRTHRCWTIGKAELAYWIGPDFQQQGFATEASACVLDFAFDRQQFNKIVLYHAKDNVASGAIPIKLGFRYVGEQREAFCKDNQWHSLKQFELLRSDHLAKTEGRSHED